MPMHMVNMRPAVFYVRLKLLAYVAARRKLIENFSLEFREEVEYFITLFFGKIFESPIDMAFGNN